MYPPPVAMTALKAVSTPKERPEAKPKHQCRPNHALVRIPQKPQPTPPSRQALPTTLPATLTKP